METKVKHNQRHNSRYIGCRNRLRTPGTLSLYIDIDNEEIAASGSLDQTYRGAFCRFIQKEEYVSSGNLLLRFLPGILSLYRKEEGRSFVQQYTFSRYHGFSPAGKSIILIRRAPSLQLV